MQKIYLAEQADGEAMTMQKVWQTIEQFDMLRHGDRVLLGVSGGPDSVALLDLLAQRQEHYGIHLHVVHVHHGLRPEADQEAHYVEQLAQSYGVPFRQFSVDVTALAREHGWSVEQAGHQARFSCFTQAAAKWQCNCLALGHHRDDRAESLLIHLLQGCGLDGLATMPPVDVWQHGRLIRPLAQVGKAALVDYCQRRGLAYYVDATNLEPHCLRNQVRLELLPQMEQYQPRMAELLVRLQDSCSRDADYLQQQTTVLWQQHGVIETECVSFPTGLLLQQHPALQRRLVRQMYQQLTGSCRNLTYEQVEQLCQLAEGQQGSQQYHLAGGVVCHREYDWLRMAMQKTAQRCDTLESCQWQLEQPFVLPGGNWKLTATWPDQPTMGTADWRTVVVDGDRLEQVLTVRTRRPGDVVQPLGMTGHKKLKRYLIDKKVPAARRDALPLVVSGGEIVWIPGYFLSECVRITPETKRFCVLSLERNNTGKSEE